MRFNTFYESDEKQWKFYFDKLTDGTLIYLVHGAYVRDKFWVDFIEGGHSYVYKWVGTKEKPEIWVEILEDSIDMGKNLGHEIMEYELMKYGPRSDTWNYDHAHDFADHAENIIRKLENTDMSKYFHPEHKDEV